MDGRERMANELIEKIYTVDGRIQKVVRAMCRGRLRSYAKDITQEAMLKLRAKIYAGNIKSTRGRPEQVLCNKQALDDCCNYGVKIARTCVIDQVRDLARRHNECLLNPEVLDRCVANEKSAVELVVIEEMECALHEAVSKLPIRNNLQEVAWLFLNGYKTKDISSIVGIELEQVRRRWRRARGILRSALQGYLDSGLSSDEARARRAIREFQSKSISDLLGQ